MRRWLLHVLVACAVAAASCNPVQLLGGDACEDDPKANHFALNPATGECWEFASSCDVPAEWAPCGGGCKADSDCMEGEGCVKGRCEARGQACASDDECPLTQRCEAGACVDNAPCAGDADCPMGQWCDLDPDDGRDGDPTAPGGEAPLVGLCSRGERSERTCATNVECASGELCPAQYGMCSPTSTSSPPDGLVCPSYCERGCREDAQCAPTERCNAHEVCGQPNPKPGAPRTAVPLPCAGWCVPR